MNRIVFMVLRNIFRAPIWFYHICKMGKEGDTQTEQQRYDYLRKMVRKVNKTGRVEIETHGIENLPTGEGFILFPNHQGLFDVLAIIESCPHPFGVVVKKEASNLILVKQVIAALRGLSIDRDDIKDSLRIIMEMTKQVMRGRNFLIFAEGTRSKDGNHIGHFKAGTFKSAVKAKCPIVPVALVDSFKPFDYPSIKKEIVQVHFLKPIYPDQYIDMKTVEIADIVHDQIQKTINENIYQNP